MTMLRRMVLALVLMEMIGTAAELVLLGHFESAWQVAPLAVIAIALLALAWYGVTRSAGSIRCLRIVMVLSIATALVGLVLHYQGNAEFQLDIDPSLSGPALWWKVMRAKTPPAPAPGAMAHVGLLGLAYTYRHPSLNQSIETTQ